MAANNTPSKKLTPVTRSYTRAYVGYIRQVVVDRKVCKICNFIDILSFINPRQHSVLDREHYYNGQHRSYLSKNQKYKKCL